MSPNILATAAFLFAAACATSPDTKNPDNLYNATTAANNAEGDYRLRGATIQNPEGDIAPMVSCRSGDIKKASER